ncbi:Cdp-alcohol phosphatidyltransferase protein [Madurella fahalii]|uniref:Cdp-alcohol phosphatidyltransferase protein n=1 Tax=Madurella fahalii TaxID=1157608 RepID=A0ABQ0FX16_9PEZI
MVSFRSTLLALAGAVAVSADLWIDPETVSMAERMAWCRDQESSCPTICLQTTTGPPITNTCNPEDLTYGCVCSDNRQPNMTEYTLTLPYHVCMRWGDQCVTACGHDNGCAASCREDNPCGAQSPTRVNTTTVTSTTSTATSAPTDRVYDDFDDSEGSTDSGENAAGALRFGNSYGLGVVAAGLFAGFAVML